MSNKENKLADQYERITEMHRKASEKFNTLAKGKTIQEYDSNELVSAIITQTDLVTKEEIIEFISNYDLDLVEELDGACDVLYTGIHLFALIKEVKRRIANGVAQEEEFNQLPMRRVNMIMKLSNFVFENLPLDRNKEGELTYDILEEASKRVIENNLSKFTTDKEYFDNWEVESPYYKRDSRILNGENYYFFSVNGKVKKKKGFVGVDLTDLFGGV